MTKTTYLTEKKGEISENDISNLVPVPTADLQEQFDSLVSQSYSENEERLATAYFTIRELMKLWETAYIEYICPCIPNNFSELCDKSGIDKAKQTFEASSVEAAKRVKEIIEMIDRQLGVLFDTGYFNILSKFNKLQLVLEKKAPKNESKARKRANELRHACNGIFSAFNTAAWKAGCPNAIRRLYKKVTGADFIKLSRENRDMLRMIAKTSLTGVSNQLAKKIGVSDKVVKAFDTIGMPLWSREDEIRLRQRVLAKDYHPDPKNSDGDEKMKEINNAVDIAISHSRKSSQKEE